MYNNCTGKVKSKKK